MFNLISIIFKYIFIIIIYMFIFSIIRLIYLDIKNIKNIDNNPGAYLKLINKIDSLPYKLEEDYTLEDDFTLGRSKDNSIVIKDPYISKRHFIISKDEGDFYIEDLNSSNGTYVNGEILEDVRKLDDKDRIKIGNIEFLFVNKE